MTFRCFILDDEPLARTSIELELQRHAGFEVTGSSGSPLRALEELVDDPPDLLFLDVRMPEVDGLEVLARMEVRLSPSRRPYVVLVTAFDHYALRAFEYDALDYLVKPFDSERFTVTLRRAEQRIRLRRIATQASPEPTVEKLCLKIPGGQALLAPHEIRWIEAADHYLLVHVEARTYLVREAVSRMAERLEPHGFLRVHRGALVHPRCVQRVEVLSDGGRRLHLSEGSCVRVSRRRWPQIRGLIAGS